MRTAIPRGASSVLLASRHPRKQRRSLVAQDRQGPNPARLRGGKPRRDRDDHQWIHGSVVVRASVAAKGEEIAGVTRGRIVTNPGPFGPASVVEFVGLPAVQAANLRLFAALDLHGFVGVQYMLEPGAEEPLLIEVNRRMLPATHGSASVGIDLARALAVVGSGRAWDGPTDLPAGPGLRMALFPQEWYRDPRQPVAAHACVGCALARPGAVCRHARAAVWYKRSRDPARGHRRILTASPWLLTSPRAARHRTSSP